MSAVRHRIRLFLIGISLLTVSPLALAHVLHFGVISATPLNDTGWRVEFRYSGDAAELAQLSVRLPPDCKDTTPVRERREVNHLTLQRDVRCASPSPPDWVEVGGLTHSDARVLVRVAGDNAQHSLEGLIDRSTPRLSATGQSSTPTTLHYIGMGISHLWGGADHMVFLLMLLVAARTLPRTLVAATSFTLGHSLTLVACSLGLLAIDTRFAEACIALSILLFAADTVRADPSTGPSLRIGPLLFGLVHGLGFASVLQETALPEQDRLMAVLLFNLGIEAGQALLIVPVALLLQRLESPIKARVSRLLVDACGMAGGFWLISRLL